MSKVGGLLGKLGGKILGPLKEPMARALYSQAMQSETGKKLTRWVPLIASTAYLAMFTLKASGWAGADTALHWLEVLGIQPGISSTELSIAGGIFAGLVRKYTGMVLEAKGEVVPPNGPPVLQTVEQFREFNTRTEALMALEKPVSFDEARRLALSEIIAKNAPVGAPARAELKAEAKAETKEAVAEAKDKG